MTTTDKILFTQACIFIFQALLMWWQYYKIAKQTEISNELKNLSAKQITIIEKDKKQRDYEKKHDLYTNVLKWFELIKISKEPATDVSSFKKNIKAANLFSEKAAQVIIYDIGEDFIQKILEINSEICQIHNTYDIYFKDMDSDTFDKSHLLQKNAEDLGNKHSDLIDIRLQLDKLFKEKYKLFRETILPELNILH